jgi:hypothetical protein
MSWSAALGSGAKQEFLAWRRENLRREVCGAHLFHHRVNCTLLL